MVYAQLSRAHHVIRLACTSRHFSLPALTNTLTPTPRPVQGWSATDSRAPLLGIHGMGVVRGPGGRWHFRFDIHGAKGRRTRMGPPGWWADIHGARDRRGALAHCPDPHHLTPLS